MEASGITSEKTAVTVGITVRYDMCSDDVVGPIFFDDNVNDDNYHQLLEAHALPFINRQFEEMVFQQDSAPVHYTNFVQIYCESVQFSYMLCRGIL